jgi:hypothetical protein
MNKEEEKKEEGLGVPPLRGSGYPLQFLVGSRYVPLRSTALPPPVGFPLLSLTRGH